MHPLIRRLGALKAAGRFSLKTIASRTGINVSRLSDIFNDEKSPDVRISTLAVLADALESEVMIVPRAKAPAVKALLASDDGWWAIRETPSALDRVLAGGSDES